MYIHRDARLIYLASPRTASMAVAEALTSQSGFSRFAGHHDGMHHPSALMILSHNGTKWTTITTVRNHWDTVISWMCWNNQNPSLPTIRDLEKGLAKARKWTKPNQLFSLHLPDAKIVWRYETLQDDLASTLQQYGLPIPALRSKNVSETRASRPYQEFYTPETQDYIADRFLDEITQLGYTF